MRKSSHERPRDFELFRKGGQIQAEINFNVEEKDGGAVYEYDSVVLPPDFTAGTIVDAVVSEEYPRDRMQAVVNNYLLEIDAPALVARLMSAQNFNKLRASMSAWTESLDPDVVGEFERMQMHRAAAKDFARRIMEEIGNIEDIDAYMKGQ